MISVEIGKCYKVHHSRKGTFTVRIVDVVGSSVSATITGGIARYISEPNREPGDNIVFSLDSPLIKLFPVET